MAENACCIEYADTWSSKRVHWLSKCQSPHHSTTNYGCKDTMELEARVGCAGQLITRIFPRVAPKSNILWSEPTFHNTGWMDECGVYHGSIEAIPILDPCECRRGIQSHCIMLSQSITTHLTIWMAVCQLWPRRTLCGRKTCSSPWS